MQCHTIKITSVDLAIIFVIYATQNSNDDDDECDLATE